MPSTCTTPRLQLEQWWAEPHRKGSLGGQSVSTASTDWQQSLGSSARTSYKAAAKSHTQVISWF
jgi:type II secretory pathway component PulK